MPVAWCLGGPDLLRKTPVPFAVPAPPIGARSAIVMDAATGQVFLDHEGHERRAPASTTKIMTAMLAYRLVPPEAEDNVVVSQTDGFAMTGSSIMGLSVNQPVSLRDLLAGLMLPSGNDAAIELARNLAPTEADFVDAMNDTADDLHLNDTHFTNPHGLDDPQHYSTAYDLAELTRHAMMEQRFAELVARQSYHLGPSLDYDVQNGNSLLALYPGSTGVKIGWTEDAGWTFVASAERDGRSIIVSLMDTPDRDADAAALLDWAFALPPVEERTGTGSGLSCIPSRKLGHQG
jgi:D-alanyl-D-alanine carboxypeptidase (penicillin-binding protein 5/6)